MVKITDIVHGKQHGDKAKYIPFSGNTVGKCIEKTAEDLKKQVLEQTLHCGEFAVQLDESTDLSNISQLITCARFCFNKEINKELLFVSH